MVSVVSKVKGKIKGKRKTGSSKYPASSAVSTRKIKRKTGFFPYSFDFKAHPYRVGVIIFWGVIVFYAAVAGALDMRELGFSAFGLLLALLATLVVLDLIFVIFWFAWPWVAGRLPPKARKIIAYLGILATVVCLALFVLDLALALLLR